MVKLADDKLFSEVKSAQGDSRARVLAIDLSSQIGLSASIDRFVPTVFFCLVFVFVE